MRMRLARMSDSRVRCMTWPALARACAIWAFTMVGVACIAQPKAENSLLLAPPAAVEHLRAATASAAKPTLVGKLEGGPGFTAALVAYDVGGRRLHALVATPNGAAPPEGFPVLMALHGFHPNPARYGYGQDGVDRRPGDYYRSVPGAYARAGFLVVMPDFRGHSNSQGLEFTSHPLAAAYYAEDVSGLMHGVAALPQANPSLVFVWGHSMGGEVTLRTLLAWPEVRAASLWSTTGGDAWEQADYYDRKASPLSLDSSSTPKPGLDRLQRALAAFGPGDRQQDREPLSHLHRLKTPLILHHALEDASTDHRWSVRLARDLYLRGLTYEFHSYRGNDHFFAEPQRTQAVQRDIAFFRAHLAPRQ